MNTNRSSDCALPLLVTLAWGVLSGCNTLVGIEEGVPCPGCTPGCPPPWQLEDPSTGHCYLLEAEKKPWALAVDACKSVGGTLAALTSAEELGAVSPLIRDSTWIGGSDLAISDTYAWSNGEPWWPHAPWVSGQPDSKDDKHCVKLSSEPPIAFENARCSSKLACLCEKP